VELKKRGKYWHYDFGIDGIRHRGSTRETSEQRALNKARAIMSAIIEGRITSNRKAPRLSEFESRFRTWLENSNLRGSTKRYYKEGWKLLKATPLLHMRLTQITRIEVDAVRFEGAGSYVNQAKRTLRRMLGLAVEWGLLRVAPTIRLAQENQRQAVISPENEKALLAHATPRLRDAFLMIQDGGMRPEEIARARIEYINWPTKTYANPHGKTKRSRRHVPLSDRLVDHLFVRAGGKTEGWLFPSKKAKSGHVHVDTLTHEFQEARDAAGLSKEIVLYSARHTFATDALGGTGNVAAVMRVMGHSKAETLMRYQHPELEQVRTAINKRNVTNAAQSGVQPVLGSRLTQ
jgi:integrase